MIEYVAVLLKSTAVLPLMGGTTPPCQFAGVLKFSVDPAPTQTAWPKAAPVVIAADSATRNARVIHPFLVRMHSCPNSGSTLQGQKQLTCG
jgi:hypothetical protein